MRFLGLHFLDQLLGFSWDLSNNLLDASSYRLTCQSIIFSAVKNNNLWIPHLNPKSDCFNLYIS